MEQTLISKKLRKHVINDEAHSMTHRICTSEPSGELPYFQHLWRILFAPDIDPRTKLERLLEQETPEFGLNYAFLSNIDLENETERFEVVHGSHEILRPGTTVSLTKTYCRKTIANPEGTMAVNDALAEGWEDDPAYTKFELGSYLGTTVSVNHELYGTLCFADTAARDEPIKDKEKALTEMYARWVEDLLTHSDGFPTQGARIDMLEGRAVSSEAIDVMMGALRSPVRRTILMALLGDTTEISIAALKRQINNKTSQIQLHHYHLPKLVEDEYIKWDADSGTISTGPKFSEIEPLVQLLKEYNMAFSE